MNPIQGSDTIALNDAAAQAAGRGLATAVLQRNPIVAVAAALLGPILGLFRRRGTPAPATVNKLKLESYSSTPLQQASARHKQGISNDSLAEPGERPAGRHPRRPAPSGGRRSGARRRLVLQEGGCHHG